MVAAPSLSLIAGSIVLALWHPSDRRAGWAVQTLAAGVALLAAILLGPLDVLPLGLGPWIADVPGSTPMALGITPWTWGLLVCVTAYTLGRSLATMGSSGEPRDRSAYLAFASATTLATVATTMLSIVVTWSLAIAAQAWVLRRARTEESARLLVGEVRGRDLASLLLLMAAFAVGGVEGASASWVAVVLLALAGCLRILSTYGAQDRSLSLAADLTFPAAATVFAALGSGLSASANEATWHLAAAGLLMLLGGWFFGWLEDSRARRVGAWVAGFGGVALLAAAADVARAGAVVAVAGMLLILVGCVSSAFPLGRLGTRIGSMAAVAMMVGVPGLLGAVLFAFLTATSDAPQLGWIAVGGIGLLGSLSLREALRPGSENSSAGSVLSGGAAGLMVVIGSFLYFRLRSFAPAPVLFSPLIALAVSLTAWLLMSLVPSSARSRLARALRWPAPARVVRDSTAAARPAAALLRGMRDVLEGDASLLWAMVVVVVGLLLLGVIP